MKSLSLSLLLGVVLLASGGYVLLDGGYFTSRREVINVGGLKISAEERHPIRPWVAGLALIAGTALIVVGACRKR